VKGKLGGKKYQEAQKKQHNQVFCFVKEKVTTLL
jgi:hypothetical protein